jgi:LysM repeat protein
VGPSINSHGQIVTSSALPSRVQEKSYTPPSYKYHTVKKGDTLSALSRRYGISMSSIQQANGLRSSVIVLGKKLRIPNS